MHWALAQTDETQSMRLSLSYHKVMRMAGWWELDEPARHCFLLSLKMFASDGPKMGSFQCPV